MLKHALDLIADPEALYHDAGPEVRRKLNETFFARIYIDDLWDSAIPKVCDEKAPVFADLQGLQAHSEVPHVLG
ncbi:hypothetical protein [Nocardia aobensis]|uniref:hypothetical protein n=1 Tax=Nocardia aobensis TaxID=257277 RepID=UPI0005685343|nr:hypothetical protein [Nocardia aobensis]